MAMKQLSQKRADQKLAKELKRERKKANKAQEEKKAEEAMILKIPNN
jgi:hypothetical protein